MARAQVWISDFLIAISVFIAILAVYFLAAGNLSAFTKSGVDVLYEQATGLSDLLLAPPGANASLAITEGDYRVNASRLAEVEAMGYGQLRLRGGVRDKVLVFFERGSSPVSVGGVSSLGDPEVDSTSVLETEKDALVGVRRYVIADDRIVSMVVYVWR